MFAMGVFWQGRISVAGHCAQPFKFHRQPLRKNSKEAAPSNHI
jgi:hypothetical protein